jgi:thiol:disulfide interchange protein DsbA
MNRLVAVTALLLLCACARQEPTPAPVTPPPPVTDVAPPPAAAPAGAQSETEQATHSQESGDTQAEHTAADASLEQMADAPPVTPLPPGKWESGTNYKVLVPAQPTSVAAGKVEVLEVFWLACPHCYALEPFIQGWLKKKPGYVEFVRVPVIWQSMHRSHAHLYYTLEVLGRQDLMAKAFEDLAQQHVTLASPDEDENLKLQQKWAVEHGVSADDFAKAYNSFSVNTDMRRAEEITNRYHIQGVPFIVVNGKYTTDVAQAGGEAKLIELISDLTAAEHGH